MLLRRGNLFLVGMPGCGKSTLGRVLARNLGKAFVDADHELEERLGVSISTIFEIEGEDIFRKREEETLARLVQRVDIVLATGGGVVLRAINRERLKANGTVLYLHASPETTFERTRHSKNRPLLQTADPLARARQLYAQRDALYRDAADLVINADQQKSSQVLAFLREQLGSALQPEPLHVDACGSGIAEPVDADASRQRPVVSEGVAAAPSSLSVIPGAETADATAATSLPADSTLTR
jgi:shikimate kinase